MGRRCGAPITAHPACLSLTINPSRPHPFSPSPAGADVLFLAILDAREVAAALGEAGLNKAQLAAAVEEGRGAAHVDSATADTQFEALTKYGIDLTAKAAELDPVIGRDEEIRCALRCAALRSREGESSGRSAGPDAALRRLPRPAPGAAARPPPAFPVLPLVPCQSNRSRPLWSPQARGARAVPPHQEQPGADRRARRRQDGDCRGPGAASGQGRRASHAQREPAAAAASLAPLSQRGLQRRRRRWFDRAQPAAVARPTARPRLWLASWPGGACRGAHTQAADLFLLFFSYFLFSFLLPCLPAGRADHLARHGQPGGGRQVPRRV